MFNRTALLQAAIFVILFNLSTTAYHHFFGEPPEVPVIESMPEQLVVGQSVRGKKQRFINVETDKMSVTIDKLGGRIVAVSFKDYQQNEQDAVSFFGREEDMLLDTQSGILGDEKLEFNANKSQYILTGDKLVVGLQASASNGVRYTKDFTFKSGQYTIEQNARAVNGGADEVSLSTYHVISGGKLTKIEKQPPKTKDLSFDKIDFSAPAAKAFSGVSYTTKSKPYVRVKFENMDNKKPDVTKGGWIAFQKHHFLAAWVLEDKPYKVRSFIREGVLPNDDSSYEQQFATQAQSGVKKLQPGESLVDKTTLYVGPQLLPHLVALDQSLKLTMDYGFFWMFASILHKMLAGIHTLVPSWTLSLIVLTALFRLVFYKATKDQTIQAQKIKKMEVEKKAIDAQFADRGRFDAEKNEAMIALYKKHNIKLFSFSAFMPILQIPLMIAFYGMVAVAVEFRSEAFGWIADVSMPDPLYIMPVLTVATMYFQSTEMTASEEFKVVARYMPIIFAYFVIKFPASLQLYLAVNTGLGLLQSKFLVKKPAA
ncbi:MAG: membrane protein insertase YidC [Pseudomonadota bacterium]|nr:membrane protein insertase YidC [Pseudomonadota bacterium]